MKRREFITLVGAATAWPFAARAQQPAMPVIGFLSSQSPENYAPFPAAFRDGLKEAGFVDGKNVTVEYRWARSKAEQLPALAADLVRRKVTVIAATGGVVTARAAMAATASIPIVFNSGEDPVDAGLVSSLNQPGGNATGVSWFSSDLAAKRLAILHQATPAATIVGFLADSRDPELPPQLAAVRNAAPALGLRLVVVNASTPDEINAGFTTIVHEGVGALLLAAGPFYSNQRAQIIALAARYAIPCSYSTRDAVVDGGLMSYGNDLQDAYRRNGLYVARILKGDKPGDLPIDRATKFNFVINLRTAKTLGLTIQPTLLATVDEVIE